LYLKKITKHAKLAILRKVKFRKMAGVCEIQGKTGFVGNLTQKIWTISCRNSEKYNTVGIPPIVFSPLTVHIMLMYEIYHYCWEHVLYYIACKYILKEQNGNLSFKSVLFCLFEI
jgi:hypothetical protein